MEVALTKLKAKQKGVLKRVSGGNAVLHRLESLGLRIGKTVTVMSSHLWRGPVTILVDKTKIAIGHGMASKIFVEIEGGK